MGRAPCCEKMGLKKGPWTPEEDLILINYINTYGHANWRALPKQAGLLRCGKSCRLRWANYLRPDIKRGNITKQEEDAIINLHEKFGNRWSAIAARLPGRTDNEIKNVWPTLLKKWLQQNQQSLPNRKRNRKKQETKLDSKSNQDAKQEQEEHVNFPIIHETEEENTGDTPQCSSDITTSDNNSSISVTSTNDDNNNNNNNNNNDMSINISNPDSPENNLALDEDFWSEVLSSDNSDETAIGADYDQFQLPFERDLMASSSSMCDDMDFWYDVYARTEELNELLEL